MINENIGHYRILRQLGSGGWVWCMKPRTHGWDAGWR